MSYDPKCDEMARYFLADTERANDEILVADLAQTVQDAVEDWFRIYLPEA